MKSGPSFEEIFAKPTMTVPELSAVLGIGLRQTYAGIRSGEFPSIRIGNRILISTRVVNQILDAGTVPDRAA